MYDKRKKIWDYLFSGAASVNYRYNWNDLDIGALLSYYLFENPTVTQAEIAKELNLAPISVSRQIKNKKSIIRDEWKSILTEYIYQLDTDYLQKQIEVLKCIRVQDLFEESQDYILEIIDRYLSDQGARDLMEIRSINLPLGLLRYANSVTQKKWLFYLLPNQTTIIKSEDIEQLFLNRVVDYQDGKQVEDIERRIVLCGNDENYMRICNLWNPNCLANTDAKNEGWYICHINSEAGIIDVSYPLQMR